MILKRLSYEVSGDTLELVLEALSAHTSEGDGEGDEYNDEETITALTELKREIEQQESA